MKKIIKRTGNSLAVIFNVEDVKVFDLKVGDIVDIKFRKEIDWEELNKRVDLEIEKEAKE